MLSKLIPAGLLLASAAWGNVITDVRAALAQKKLALADAFVQHYRTEHGVTPELIEGISWLGRGALAVHEWDKAEGYAKETQRLVVLELRKRPLDAEPHLPLALGAAIEVQSQILNGRAGRGEALNYLRGELARYRDTSIRTRIQKNINLLSLEGKIAPRLDEREHLGVRPVSLSALRSKPVLLFFWAHWCGDCKHESPILAEIQHEYAAKGLQVVAPTQRYGYVARGEEAGPAEELKYIDQVRHQYYPELLDVPVPVSAENFKNYGASTTPTLVLIDRHGIVRLYHPGNMTIEELRAALDKIV